VPCAYAKRGSEIEAGANTSIKATAIGRAFMLPP
jgi:hypothetical protein